MNCLILKIRKMKKILLICNAGASTSLFVTNLNEYSEEQGNGFTWTEMSNNEAKGNLDNFDAICVAPQIQYMAVSFTKETTKPVIKIPPMVYGRMETEKLTELVKAEL